MDINNIANLATAMSAQKTGDAVAISVLKKALETQASGALALIQALPQVPASLPPHLGNNVNTTA